MGRLRAGIEQAPPDVLACLRKHLGPNIIEDIESGNLVPGPAIGEWMRERFEPSPDVCLNFALAPTCDLVPKDVRDICRKCNEL